MNQHAHVHTTMLKNLSYNEPYPKLHHKQTLVGDSRDFCMGYHWTKIIEWLYLSQK